MDITNIPLSVEDMATALHEHGIRCEPVMMAIVPRDYGTPYRNDEMLQAMSIEKAYETFIKFKADRDPFE